MPHQYRRRTFDEAQELAREAFRACVTDILMAAEIEELGKYGTLTGGTPGGGWEAIIGFTPDEHSFYEIQIYKPSDAWPHIEKSYVRMLAPRDRSTEHVHFMWRPPIAAPNTSLERTRER